MKILSELSNDASISVPKLAEKINTNSSVVYSRIKRLQKQKLIKKFTIDVSDNIIEKLFNIDGVREISEVTGRFDIMVTMYAKNLNEMHKVVSEKIGKIEGILGSESFIEMKRRAKSMPYLVEQ